MKLIIDTLEYSRRIPIDRAEVNSTGFKLEPLELEKFHESFRVFVLET